jgi:hypothetical protein
MKNELDIVRDVSVRLDGAGIDYMLTGSMAMNYYAQPRMTRDIDVVLALRPADAARVVALFGADYYVSREAVESSIAHASLFNLIHHESVIKVDCIIRKQSEYRLTEFNRRQRIRIEDFETWIVSKEDLILSKLFWAKDSHSELQLRDVKNLVSTGCDRGYITRVGRRRSASLAYGRKSHMNDTPPEIAELVRQKLMARSGAERFVMGTRMFDAALAVVVASLPPKPSPLEARRQLFQRLYGQPAPF